jgi:hypothetical protein
MTHDETVKALLDGTVLRGKTYGDRTVIASPIFLDIDVICYRVTSDRAIVTEGVASDAARVFLGLVVGDAVAIGQVLRLKETKPQPVEVSPT